MNWTPEDDEIPPLSATRSEMIEWVARRAEDGVDCPCCTRFVKVYPNRKITNTTARVLREMYLRARDDWAHLPSICNDLGIGSRGDETRAREWGLIEKHPNRRPDGAPSTGWWKLTPLGVRFVRGEVTITKYARVFDNEVLEFHGPQVYFNDCLDEKFHYDENLGR